MRPARCRLSLVVCLLIGTQAASAQPSTPRWQRFTAILWQSDLPASALAKLQGLGIAAGRVFGQRGPFDPAALQADVAALRRAGLDTMVENIATDFYSAYHRWKPGLPVNAAFLDLLARYHADPADPAVWRRDPGLADPVALATIEHRLTLHASSLSQTPPLYFSLGDETGIADLSAASDLDQSEGVLERWRATVRRRYGTIAALNRAWDGHYASWTALRPTSTDAALAGTAPLAAWMDFKAYMDTEFAHAVGRGAAAVHAGDAHAEAAIEGAQLPGWGGYDYATLPPMLDVIEAGEPDPCFGLIHSFNARAVPLTTVVPDATAAHRLWRSLLLGGRGAVIWDEGGTIMHPDGTPGPGGLALAPVLADLRGPLGTALMAAERPRPQVGVIYSQASFRLQWLLDRRVDRDAGKDWTKRDNDTDLADSPWRNALAASATALGHLGLQPKYLDAASLSPARLGGLRAVMLPHAVALSDHAVAALRHFAARGGIVVADTEPGMFDDLGHPRGPAPLARVGVRVPGFPSARLRRVLQPSSAITTQSGQLREDVSLFPFDAGRLVAIQADEAGGSGPALLTWRGLRCTLELSQSAPTVIASSAKGWARLSMDGTRSRLSCENSRLTRNDDGVLYSPSGAQKKPQH